MKDDLNYVHSRVEQGHSREHDQELNDDCNQEDDCDSRETDK